MITDFALDFQNIFYFEDDLLTLTNEIKHLIKIGNSTPVFTKSFCYPLVYKEMNIEIGEISNQGIIRHSLSWSSST